MTIENNQIKIT